jgi:hypothetical protein
LLHREELRFRTDFNSIREDGLITAMLGFGGADEELPEVGSIVRLFDGDDNSCLGVVEAILDDELILVHPEWSTWRAKVKFASEREVDPVDLMEALKASVLAARTERAETGGVAPERFDISAA